MARSTRGSPGGAPGLHRADRRRVGGEAEDGLSTPVAGESAGDRCKVSHCDTGEIGGSGVRSGVRASFRVAGEWRLWPEWTSCDRCVVASAVARGDILHGQRAVTAG